MKIISLFAVITLLALLAGCDSPTTTGEAIPVEQGNIAGIVRLDPGVQGTVAGTYVHLYCSPEAACANQPGMTVMIAEDGAFSFAGVCCGTHYLGIWKDNDANGVLSSGDYSFDRANPECCWVQKGATDYHVLNVTVVP